MDVDSGASASAAGKTKWFTDLNMQTYRDNMEVNVRGLLFLIMLCTMICSAEGGREPECTDTATAAIESHTPLFPAATRSRSLPANRSLPPWTDQARHQGWSHRRLGGDSQFSCNYYVISLECGRYA